MTENQSKQKKLGLFTLLMLTLGSMIGAGIFVVPNELRSYGVAASFGWILASLCAILLARVFGDLALQYSGDSFPLAISRSMGQPSGFIAGFNQWFYLVLASTAIIFTFGNYFFNFTGINSGHIQFLVIAGISLLCVILHTLTDIGLRVIEAITSLKVLVFMCLSVLVVLSMKLGAIFGGFTLNIPNIFLILQSAAKAIFAFAGLESCVSKASDAKDPKNNIPRAITISTLICSCVYLLTHSAVISSGTTSATPITNAIEIVGPHYFGALFSKILALLSLALGMFGCLGTFMVIIFIAPNVLKDTLSIANPGFKTYQSRTQFPVIMGIINVLFIITMAYLKYMINIDVSLIFDTANFSLVLFYFYCIILSMSTRPKRIGLPGLAACMTLFIGCSQNSVYLGCIIQILAQGVFALTIRRHRHKSLSI